MRYTCAAVLDVLRFDDPVLVPVPVLVRENETRSQESGNSEYDTIQESSINDRHYACACARPLKRKTS